MRIPNSLIHATSPYLLQHAYNPVQWYPWGEEALRKAREENKLIIVSIGYSACHWCHVMEHESFEDEEVATVMNKSFVCIKVDREERPDIDQVYMDALQLMTGKGGWPLNVITLPDQRPVYGGTYFPKERWREILLHLAAFFRNDPVKCNEYAAELTEGLQRISGLVPVVDNGDRSYPDHSELLQRWSKHWDNEEGGSLRVPKFPLPDSYRYLLAAAHVLKNKEASEHVALTLRKMAFGGLFDQIGGGFTRYSTDMYWKVPHFEKMLYDNALLLSLYADAYKSFGDELYKEVALQSIEFVFREMYAQRGGCYSALDADSEGVEGKYYCWTLDEVKSLTGEDFELACDYFNLNEKGYWEHDLYIPLKSGKDEVLAEKYGMSLTQLKDRVAGVRKQLFERRSSRIRPGLDTKIICSWNALMISGCLDAYSAFQDETCLVRAREMAAFIRTVFLQKDFRLLHCASEQEGKVKAAVDGFLEDYAFVIEAFISMHAVTMEESFLRDAVQLTETVIREFFDSATGLFWFTASGSEKLIARKHEVQDNVIPSSNAVMSHNLFRLSVITGNSSYESMCRRMLMQVKEEVVRATPWYSRWARVFLQVEQGNEVAISGPQANEKLKEILRVYLPLSVIVSSEKSTDISLLKNRFLPDRTSFYVCRNQTCHAPVENLKEALLLLNK